MVRSSGPSVLYTCCKLKESFCNLLETRSPALVPSLKRNVCAPKPALKPVIHRSENSYMFLLWSHEGLEQLLEALWRNFLLDTNVEQMGVLLLPVWQEIITIL